MMLFVGELHWWTTDAELEAALSEYGRVKNLKFFEEKASGKSKGYCQVEFYDALGARMCKEKMDGRVFNGRACVVAFASPQSIKQMGAAQTGKNQASVQGPGQAGQGKKVEGGGRSRWDGPWKRKSGTWAWPSPGWSCPLWAPG
jgi:cleavage and polyadenylation specificity factor subunit 6/7